MRRTSWLRAITATLAGTAMLVALAGCAFTRPSEAAIAAPLDAEVETLMLLGFDDAEDYAADSGWPRGRGRGPLAGRPALRKNQLHGEVTVQTDDGLRTIVGQRGEVTTVDGSSLTVESTDGFVLTWDCADQCRIVDQGTRAEDLSVVEVGDLVGVAGVRQDTDLVARLVILPKAD
ncbi:hypothetical protein ACN27F_05315 [Solwaraspora sp. WMMB335]|uniref:hypothetical protein n=1 Tax=Solwaraspora sp. WMMB335 TaxID=3404118 RepID=UPI003B946377